MRLRNEKTDPKLFKHILDEQGDRINIKKNFLIMMEILKK